MPRLRTTEDLLRETGDVFHPRLRMVCSTTRTRKPHKPWCCSNCGKTFQFPTIQVHHFIDVQDGVMELAYCVPCENFNFSPGNDPRLEDDPSVPQHIVWDEYNVLDK